MVVSIPKWLCTLCPYLSRQTQFRTPWRAFQPWKCTYKQESSSSHLLGPLRPWYKDRVNWHEIIEIKMEGCKLTWSLGRVQDILEPYLRINREQEGLYIGQMPHIVEHFLQQRGEGDQWVGPPPLSRSFHEVVARLCRGAASAVSPCRATALAAAAAHVLRWLEIEIIMQDFASVTGRL